MRLIDADEFIKKFRYAEADTEDEKNMCATVRRMIKEQPTAFDAEKVIKQLEEERDYSYEDYENYAEKHDMDVECDDLFCRGLDRAIEIFKRGEREC